MDLYTSTALMEFTRIGIPDAFFLVQRLFNEKRFTTSEKIAFDEMVDKYIIAPFVSPAVNGKPVVGSGYSTKTFTPAYIKLDDAIRPSDLQSRAFGEPINVAPNELQRFNAGRLDILRQHKDAIMRRLEWMCWQYVLTGGYTVSGPDYPTQVLDFGRDAGNTATLSGVDLWSAPTTATPKDDLEAWSQIGLAKAGVPLTECYFSLEAWAAFSNTDQVKDEFKDLKYRADPLPNLSPEAAAKVWDKGYYGDFRILVFNDFYEENGSQVRYLPAGKIVMVAPGEMGVGGRALFGGIQHMEAIKQGMNATDIFQWEYTMQDGSAHKLASHSGPLIAGKRVNATLSATVL